MDFPKVRYIVQFQRMGGESDYYKVVDTELSRIVEKDLSLVVANRLRDKLNGLCQEITDNG